MTLHPFSRRGPHPQATSPSLKSHTSNTMRLRGRRWARSTGMKPHPGSGRGRPQRPIHLPLLIQMNDYFPCPSFPLVKDFQRPGQDSNLHVSGLQSDPWPFGHPAVSIFQRSLDKSPAGAAQERIVFLSQQRAQQRAQQRVATTGSAGLEPAYCGFRGRRFYRQKLRAIKCGRQGSNLLIRRGGAALCRLSYYHNGLFPGATGGWPTSGRAVIAFLVTESGEQESNLHPRIHSPLV